METTHEDSNFVGREPCPECGSKDNLARYDDGHAFCFSQGCGYRERADGSVPRKTPTATGFTPLQGEFKSLKSRCISEATCKLYRYRMATFKGQPAHVVDVVDRTTGQLLAQKIRGPDKAFAVLGDISTKPLIGAQLWHGGKRLVITEGEIDMLTVSEVQGNKWPVVSLPNGAAAAKKCLLANIDYLKQFEEVVLMFDMDEVGQEAARESADALMSLITVKIAKLSMKDPNELHVAGRSAEITQAVWNAEEHKPDGLVDAGDLIEEAMLDLPAGLPWMFDGLNASSNGRHYGEVHTIGAGTGVGKTDFLLQQAAFDVLTLQLDIGLFLVENEPVEILKYLAGKADGRFYYENGHPDASDKAAMYESMQRFSGKVKIYDNFGLCEWTLIKSRIIYLISQGIRVFYIDHLTALATGGERDEKIELEAITADTAEIAQRYQVLLILVSHLSTPEGESHEEGGRVSIKNFKGSRAIGFWSHAMYGLERDQQAEDEDERQVTTIRQLKRRKYGKGVGKTTRARYDGKTGRSAEVHATPFEDETQFNQEF